MNRKLRASKQFRFACPELTDSLQDFCQQFLPDTWKVMREITMNADECRVPIVDDRGERHIVVFESRKLNMTRSEAQYMNSVMDTFVTREAKKRGIDCE